MANTIINPIYYAGMTQVFLRSQLVAAAVSNTKWEANITPGKTIEFPYGTSVRLQNYTFSANATIDAATFTSDQLTVNQVKITTQNYDTLQNMQSHDPEWMDMQSEEMAYQMARNIDQYSLATGIAGAQGTVVGGTLTSSTLFGKMGDVKAVLTRQRAGVGIPFAILDAERISLLSQIDVAGGFNRADSALKNGWVGDSSAGFKVYVSNDLPCTQILTVDTQPTVGDTFTVLGYTWTCIADGGVCTAGQIKIGANVADFKLIFVTAINGTTPPSAGDYLDYSVEQRRDYQNAQLAASAFATNDCTLTTYGKIGGSETFTTGTNVFGTETSTLLFGMIGAPSLCVQAQPNIEERQEPQNLSINILGTTMFGAKIFHRDAARLVKMTINL